MVENTTSIRNLILILAASATLLIASGKLSVLILFLVLLGISKKIVKTQEGIFYMSVSMGVIVAVFFHWYWETYYGNSYFLGRKSDDWQYDELWTKGFLEIYNLNFNRLSEHLNSIERGLGILHNSKGYVITIILLRWLSEFIDGYHTLIPRILNIFVLGYTAYYSSLIAYYYKKDGKLRRTVFLFVFFFPVMLFNSVHVFRDTIVGFIVVFVYYLLLTSKYSLTSVFKVVIAMSVLYYFRKSTFFVSVLMILLLYINPKKISFKLGISMVVFSFIALIALEHLFFNLLRQLSDYNQLNTERFGNIGGKIFALPLYVGAIPRVIYMIFTPVPNFSGFHQMYQSISAFLQVYFFPYLFVGLFVKPKIIDFKLKVCFLLFFLGVAFSTATFRHVTMYIPLGVVIVCLTLYNYKLSNRTINNYLGYLLILVLTFVFSIGIAFTF